MICFYRAINAIKACALVYLFQAPVFATVSAQDARAQVETKKRAFELTYAANGELIWTPAARALPGRLLEYELSYRNMSDVALDDFILVGELPIAAEYVSKTALSGPKLSLKCRWRMWAGCCRLSCGIWTMARAFYAPWPFLKKVSKRSDGTWQSQLLRGRRLRPLTG